MTDEKLRQPIEESATETSRDFYERIRVKLENRLQWMEDLVGGNLDRLREDLDRLFTTMQRGFDDLKAELQSHGPHRPS